MTAVVKASTLPEIDKDILEKVDSQLTNLIKYTIACEEKGEAPTELILSLLHKIDIAIVRIEKGKSIHITVLCHTEAALHILWESYTTHQLKDAFQALYQSEYNRLQPELETPRDAVVSVSVELSEDEYRLCKSELTTGHQDTEVEGDSLVTSPISQTGEGEPQDECKLLILNYVIILNYGN